jgi:hypothetical protein
MFPLIFIGIPVGLAGIVWVLDKMLGGHHAPPAAKIMKEMTDVFNIPIEELRLKLINYAGEWIISPIYVPKLVRILTDGDLNFIFSFKTTSLRSIHETELIIGANSERAKKGEISISESLELDEKAVQKLGIKTFNMAPDHLFQLIHEMRFPPSGYSLFKPESWVDLNAEEKIKEAKINGEFLLITVERGS